jgi:hypothetical protein
MNKTLTTFNLDFIQNLKVVCLLNWLIDCIDLNHFPLENPLFIKRRHHCQWGTTIEPMLGAYGLWVWRNLFHATPERFFAVSPEGSPHLISFHNKRGHCGPILSRIPSVLLGSLSLLLQNKIHQVVHISSIFKIFYWTLTLTDH